MAAKPEKARARLGTAVGEVFDLDFLRELAQSIKEMTKGVRGTGNCPECGSARSVLVQIPDIQGQIKALTELMEQAEGRPGTESGEAGGVTLIVERKWPVISSDPEELALGASVLPGVADPAGGDEVGGEVGPSTS